MNQKNTYSFFNILFIIFLINFFGNEVFGQNKFPNKPEDYTSIAKVTSTANGKNLTYKNPYTDSLITTFAGTFNGTLNSQSRKFYCIDLRNWLVFNEDYWDEGTTSSEVTYILNNYFPFKTSYPGMLSDINREAAAIQVAIWHFTDSVDANTITNDNIVKTRALQIINDAINNHNNVKPINTLLIVLTSHSYPVGTPVQFYVFAYDINGNPVSNVVIHLSTSAGSLSIDSVITDVNGQGGPITLTFLGEGSAIISATSTVTIPQGTRYVHKLNPNGKQKLVLATPATDTKQVQDTVSWYTPQLCDLTGYVTYTQGGWGSPSSSVPGKLRDMYFSAVFPTGLVVGSNYTLTLTNALAVKNFLPQGGTAGALTQNYVNPLTTSAGVLAGQVVALKLNVMFNQAGYLGSNPFPLGNLIIKMGPFTGWTVNHFLAFAEQALGGGSLNGYSFDDINSTATAINENFDNGKVNNGYLDCPENVYGKIGDFVWFDTNENGIQDSGEAGIPNVLVTLFTCSGDSVAATYTNPNGKYQFQNVIPGSYYVRFTLPNGYQFTIKDAGSDDLSDSDADLLTGKTDCFTLGHGQTNNSIDAGMYYLKASVGNYVWFDSNENGIQDNGENGIKDVVVKLFDCSDNLIATTNTDSSGHYLFNNLNPGNYYIQFLAPDSLKFTLVNQGSDDELDSDADAISGKTNCFSLAPGENNLSLDAGLVFKRSSIGDFVWNDINMNGIQEGGEPGFAGIVVKLYNCNGTYITQTTTDSTGHYNFTDLLPAYYKIEVVLPDGYQFTLQNQGSNEALDSDVNPSNGQSDCVYVGPNTNYADLDAGIHLIPPPPFCSIGDRVWMDVNKNGIQDASEVGVPNIEVKLFDCNGNFISSQHTDSDGYYKFDSVYAGSYKIKFIIPSSLTFTLKDQGSNDLLDSDVDPVTGETVCINIDPNNCGENDVKWDAGVYPTPPAPTCTLGDKVWEDVNKNGIQDYGESGVGYVSVKLLDCNGQVLQTTQTDENGNYHFTNIPGGNYKIRVVLPSGYAFTVKDAGSNDLLDSDVDPITGMTECFSIDPPNCDSNSIKWDAGIYKLKGSIGDFVWFDTNKNGIQDNGETGLAGITVKLYDCNDNLISTTTTNSQGKYLFSDLLPGNYYVRFFAPTGYLFTIKDAGSNDQKDSDADPLTGKTMCFTLNAGQNDLSWDAGLSECIVGYKVCGLVFNDVNGNGTQDPGEVGIENVVVKLWGTSANLIAQTITDALGRFEFNNVVAGEYHVQEIDPDGYISTTPNSYNIFVTNADVCGIKFGDKVKPVPEPCNLALYKTYTQDQWCLEPAKSLLENNFSTVFPSGMVIGNNGAPYSATFTNALAVKNFLPQIGPVGQFTTNYTNPTTTSAGSFAGNVAALMLNVAFNDAGLLGSPSTTKFKNLVIASGPMKDYKVSEVLLLANVALGGGTTPFSVQVLNDVVSMINYNFACDCNYGFLTCPPPPDTCGGGYDAGVESNANLADLLLKRLTKIEYGMTTKILRNPKIAFTASAGLYELLPQYGPMGSIARESTPFDILGISNATSAYAVDYNLPLTKGEARIAGVFATTTNPPYIYEHTKAICDRLIDAELKSLTQVKIGENYYFASVIDKVNEGVTDYEIHFSVYEKGNKFIVDSRWLIEDYQVPSGVTNIYNFQVWGSNFKNAMFLVNQIIDQFKSRGEVEFLNRAQLPVSMVYVQKGKYLHNGSIEMVVKNENQFADNVTVLVRSRATQGGERIEQIYTYTLSPGLNSISIKTGILSDANIYIVSSNGFKDEIFVSGGAYTFLNGQNSTVDFFDTKSYPAQNLKDYPEGSLVLSGGVRLQGKLNDWVTIFRSLTANTAPVDLSDYESIRFTIKGNGIVWLRLEQDGIKNFNFHMKKLVLDETERTYTIPFSEFVQREGNSVALDPSRLRKISLVYEKRDNMNLTNYDVELKNIAFLSKNGSKKSDVAEIPTEYKLSQNYPNPFNPSTMIEFSIIKPEFVSLKVYNILGQEVATLVNEVKNPGSYSVRFDASHLSSGVYIYRLQTESFTSTKKMILQK